MAANTALARWTADSAAYLTTWAAGSVVDTGLAGGTTAGGATNLSSCAARCAAEAGLIGITTNPLAAVVRATISIPTAANAGIITAGSVITGVTGRTTNAGAGRRITMLALAGIARSRETNRAADVGSRAAESIETTLAGRAIDAAAKLAAGAAHTVDTRLAGVAANAIATIARATVTAAAATVDSGHTRAANSVVANLNGRAAVCSRVAGTIAAVVPDAADRSGGRTGALVAKPFVVGSITGAFACRWRVGTEDLGAPFGAVSIGLRPPEYAAYAAQAEEAAERHRHDGSECVAPRCRASQRLWSVRQIGSLSIACLCFKI